MYHYANHPEDLEALGEFTPAQVVKAVARLSDKLNPPAKEEKKDEEEQPVKIQSKAPVPIKPVSGGSTKNSVPLDQADMAEYKKRRAAGERR
jgi:hypothetical protein